ncbi:hypothetical protein VHEMI07552 [[Torrubiella] hemipterigena]|uniref:Uncharacterized protein n=1 Tax=[Torrubiella] hemipterigena TaxID=1531966 RepID=A0A0A1TAS1_9HYPO|nr:hypothetical protein VHEMI07552 [[Torrubiella] hemipterigena]
MTLSTTSSTSAVGTLENLTTGKCTSHTWDNGPSTLCNSGAEWIVEQFFHGQDQAEFVPYGSVTFTDAYISTDSGAQITPSTKGSDVITLKNNGVVRSTCSTSKNTLTCNST